jgi:hypothetical protein
MAGLRFAAFWQLQTKLSSFQTRAWHLQHACDAIANLGSDSHYAHDATVSNLLHKS